MEAVAAHLHGRTRTRLDTHTHRHTDTQTHRHRHTHTHTHTHTLPHQNRTPYVHRQTCAPHRYANTKGVGIIADGPVIIVLQ